MRLYIILPLVLVINFSVVSAYEPIPITLSTTMDKVYFDGKWTFLTEWKQTSLNEYVYDDGKMTIVLRSAHQGDFVYIFIDAITDYTLDKQRDSAIICFDSNNDKTEYSGDDDYCFMTILDGGMGVTYRGDPTIQNFTIIPNHDEFIGLSTVSDDNDRYTPIPHTGFEFKIPTQVIGRNNIYGFYFSVYDDHSKKYYTYPQNLTNTMINSPSLWGEIYSPDKSLPEFSLPILLLLPALGLALYLTRHKLGHTLKMT